jgi:hypothetical protein
LLQNIFSKFPKIFFVFYFSQKIFSKKICTFLFAEKTFVQKREKHNLRIILRLTIAACRGRRGKGRWPHHRRRRCPLTSSHNLHRGELALGAGCLVPLDLNQTELRKILTGLIDALVTLKVSQRHAPDADRLRALARQSVGSDAFHLHDTPGRQTTGAAGVGGRGNES